MSNTAAAKYREVSGDRNSTTETETMTRARRVNKRPGTYRKRQQAHKTHALFCRCMHACMHQCMHVCTCACMYLRVRACMHACIYLCMYVCMHKCMHVCTCCIKAYSGASHKNLKTEHRQHLHTHTYIHTCMHAYMPAFVQTRTRQKVVGNFKAARLVEKNENPNCLTVANYLLSLTFAYYL